MMKRDMRYTSEGRHNDMEIVSTGPPEPLTEEDKELLRDYKRIQEEAQARAKHE
ncbi:MAG: hypothetical protein M0P69_18180 [Bacteroidales bacterium]|nr:hypothetical protein [Bacteroidales bacterium]MDI9605514.1 hypothetical protein [Bacteroidota bacterium]